MRCRIHLLHYLSLEHKSSSIPEALSVFVPLIHYLCQHLTISRKQTAENITENFYQDVASYFSRKFSKCFVGFLVSHVPVLHVKLPRTQNFGHSLCASTLVYSQKIKYGSSPVRCYDGRLRLKCDGTRAENRFRLSAKRTSPFKSARERHGSRQLAAEVCASAVVMLDTPCSEVM